MAHEDAGHYRNKHPKGTKCDPKVMEALKHKTQDGKLACALAHKIAEELELPPSQVGIAMDFMEIRLQKCQLGLFGYKSGKKLVEPARSIPSEIEKGIKSSLENQRISCESCWNLADKLGISRLDIACACEALGVKVSTCQLGAF